MDKDLEYYKSISENTLNLLDEALDWLCQHSDCETSYTGGREWCCDCHNYLRSPEDYTLKNRIYSLLVENGKRKENG